MVPVEGDVFPVEDEIPVEGDVFPVEDDTPVEDDFPVVDDMESMPGPLVLGMLSSPIDAIARRRTRAG